MRFIRWLLAMLCVGIVAALLMLTWFAPAHVLRPANRVDMWLPVLLLCCFELLRLCDED